MNIPRLAATALSIGKLAVSHSGREDWLGEVSREVRLCDLSHWKNQTNRLTTILLHPRCAALACRTVGCVALGARLSATTPSGPPLQSPSLSELERVGVVLLSNRT